MNSIEVLNNRVRTLFDQLKPFLDEAANSTLSNYLNHYEFEMAFEGIFIELKNLGYIPSNIDKKHLLELASDLQLDKEMNQVLVNDFWTEFVDFLEIQ